MRYSEIIGDTTGLYRRPKKSKPSEAPLKLDRRTRRALELVMTEDEQDGLNDDLPAFIPKPIGPIRTIKPIKPKCRERKSDK